MTVLDTLTEAQKNAIVELQMRVKSSITPKYKEEIYLYYIYLKARDFDVGKAEKMLRNASTWRKIHQVDTILEDFTPSEFFVKHFAPSVLGYDKESNIIMYNPTGILDPLDVIRSATMSHWMRHWMWFVENTISMVKAENERLGRNSYQAVVIINLDKVPLSSITSPVSADIFLRLIKEYQDNYPELLRSAYVINAPSFFVIVFSILKSVIANNTLNKIHIFGSSGWKEKLLEVIDADVLPAFLGGKRTDPDGDPLCKTFVNHCLSYPKHYYLTHEERFFDKTCQPIKAVILPKEKKEIEIEVDKLGTVIQWKFHVKSKDIRFGIFLESQEHKSEEVIPLSKYHTPDGAEKGLHKCRSTGKFIIIFDNSHSWLNAKEVQYVISVVEPEV